MCLLCNDEKAYAAYMHYLDEMERQGQNVDPDKAIDAVIDMLEAETAKAKKNKSPFHCDPIEE